MDSLPSSLSSSLSSLSSSVIISHHQSSVITAEQRPPIGLDWIGLDWIGLDWIGLDWIGLDWIGLDWIGLDWIGLDWIGLDWIGLDWIGLDWIGLDWIGLDWIGLDWVGLDWIGLDWIGLDWIGETTSQIEGDAFISGQQYQYHYNGKIASGIPGVQRQWSGLALDHKIIIQVRSDHWVVKFDQIRTDLINKHIHSVNHHEFDYRPSVEFSEHLSKPFKVYYEEGLIKKFYVQRDEPEWSVNLKKAVLTQFQVNLRQYNPLRIQKGNYLVKPDANSNYFRVMEDGIGGECETMYNIMSVPDVETPYHNNVLNVTKTRNYENCKHRPITGYTNMVTDMCAECEPELIRTKFISNHAQTYYKIRGDRYHFLIEAAYTDSETVLSRFGVHGQSLITHVNQSIVLDHVTKATPIITPNSDAVPVYSLSYKFPARIQFRDLVDLKKAHSIYTTHGYTADINLIGTVFETIAQSYKNINLEQNLKNNYTTKYAELVKHFTTLSYDKINRLHNQYADYSYDKATAEEKAKVNLFMDILHNVGTNPSYMFVRHLIQTGRITPLHAVNFFSKLAFAVKEPTEVLVDDIFRLCSHSEVIKSKNVQRTCYLAFAGLVHEHCVKAETRFPPTSTSQKSCTPEITEKYVNYLQQKFEQSYTPVEKSLFIMALGTVGAQKTISVLKPIVQGRTNDPLSLRQAAGWALYPIAKLYPEEVLSVVSPVLFNATEDHEIRIVAFSVMIQTKPSLYHYYDIVETMKYDKNIHVQNYIYTTLQYLSNSTHPCHTGIAYNANLAFETLKSSNFTPVYSPNYSFRYVNGGYNRQSTTPIEFGFRTQGLDKIVDKIFGPEGIFYKSESVLDILSRKPRSIDNIRKELKEIEEALTLSPREYEPVVGYLYLMRYGHVINFLNFDETTFKNFLSQKTFQISDIFALYKQGVKYHNQMYTLGIDFVLQVPSEIGLPIIIDGKLPTQTSVNLEQIKFKVDPAVFAKDRNYKAPKTIEISTNGRISTDTVTVASLSVLSPFEKLQYGTGYEIRHLTTIPLKGSVKYDVPTSKISSEYEPFHEEIHRTTFEPFTFIDSYANLVPLQEESSYSPIGIHKFEHEAETNYGQDYLGVGLNVKSKYYGFFYDQASYVSFLNEHDWRSVLYYFWTNPHMRPYQFNVKMTPASTRKTSKFVGSVQLKYHHLASDASYSPVHAERDSEFDTYTGSVKSRRPQTISVVANIKTEGDVERKLDAELVYQWSFDSLYHRYGLYAERTPFTSTESKTKYCVNSLVQMPPREWKKIIDLKAVDINTKSTSKIHIGWGSDCTSDKTIDVTSSYDRTEEQLSYLKQIPQFRSHYKSHTYPYHEAYPHPAELGYNPYVDLYHRCIHQQSQGFTMNYECLEFIKKATETRKFHHTINYKNIPEYFSNATMKTFGYFNFKVFPHIDYYFNPALNRPAGLITVKANVSVHYPVFDAEIKVPQGNVHYSRVYQPYYYPFSTIYQYAVTNGYYQHYLTNYKHLTYSTCTFDKFIQTFSNTSYESPLTDCYHVIAKDCSENEEYTVLIAQSTSDPKHKNLKVILKEKSIEMIPYGGAIKVRVDGKAVPVKPTEPYFHYRTIGSSKVVDFVIRIVDGLYFIDVPHTGLYLQFDGKVCTPLRNRIIYGNDFEGQVCFSTKPLPECNRRCKPTRILTEDNVEFHCLSSNDDYAQRLIAVREKRVMYELNNKAGDKKAKVQYPESCTSEY
ncbi:Vitellogenin-6 [Nymphon striatum]|nr:Vitellogenin-6 [Nymphon striatum]